MINKAKTVTPLDMAINAVGGSQKILAEKVGVTPQAINMLKKRGGSLPVTKMRKYEEVTGLSKEVLYPGIFTA
ncbi:helix-turn-helix domain-containing protein [Salmonella enterica]|uniref:helix-turn-helix domain-containing protein n=1 Tax=Enterobacteriaceae TaxID=543 RepID=UPI0006BCF1D4|nr:MULTISPECIES: helix-turn-helix domain-containing protein [Enterobacteriaceae]EAA9074278.1 helix-turn-helix domain-containing protein [Salmonella enterica subsp. enterica]EAM9332334.1 helix-turn-helix domain-containing protein [Salmonella enterica]EDB4177962.1 helix-turn-helix domain-containing protein [Salmonella enterica subsp. enterica serovar Poona]EEJ7600345.1 helix-turn-helix domain-containing protein [Salmonella enterica subsp. enterica serovar Kiambu]MDU1184787.1 helix-turn-helix dom